MTAIGATMAGAKDYRAIFQGVESTLIRVGSQDGREEELYRTLEEAKAIESKSFTDQDYFRTLIVLPFYSGFAAEKVTSRLTAIEGHFRNYETVAGYGDAAIEEILHDAKMIKNRRKVSACVDNAKTFRALIAQYGSFHRYLDSFSPRTSFDNILRLRKDLIERFRYISKITSFHFLTDIGMPVLKPDRVIRRIFFRLGLIADEDTSEVRLLETVREGLKFVQATGHPIRYVDIVFVAYGQVNSTGVGISQGICLKENPRCAMCGVTSYCRYPGKTNA